MNELASRRDRSAKGSRLRYHNGRRRVAPGGFGDRVRLRSTSMYASVRAVAILRCLLFLNPVGCDDRDDAAEYQRVEREDDAHVNVTVEVHDMDDDDDDYDDDDDGDDDDDDDGDDDDDDD
jgi:hypothetical protein